MFCPIEHKTSMLNYNKTYSNKIIMPHTLYPILIIES